MPYNEGIHIMENMGRKLITQCDFFSTDLILQAKPTASNANTQRTELQMVWKSWDAGRFEVVWI